MQTGSKGRKEYTDRIIIIKSPNNEAYTKAVEDMEATPYASQSKGESVKISKPYTGTYSDDRGRSSSEAWMGYGTGSRCNGRRCER